MSELSALAGVDVCTAAWVEDVASAALAADDADTSGTSLPKYPRW